MDSPHKGLVTGKMSPFDNVIMIRSNYCIKSRSPTNATSSLPSTFSLLSEFVSVWHVFIQPETVTIYWIVKMNACLGNAMLRKFAYWGIYMDEGSFLLTSNMYFKHDLIDYDNVIKSWIIPSASEIMGM